MIFSCFVYRRTLVSSEPAQDYDRGMNGATACHRSWEWPVLSRFYVRFVAIGDKEESVKAATGIREQ